MAESPKPTRPGQPELLTLAGLRATAWRELHDRESLVSGSADGWLILDTLDALLAEREAVQAFVQAFDDWRRCPPGRSNAGLVTTALVKMLDRRDALHV
jgi:hypothetical protein